MTFTLEQVQNLLKPIKPHRVSQAQGKSHVEAWEITAHLTRLFGFGGWHKEIIELECIHEHSEEKGNRTGWWVVYRCRMRLHVGDWWCDDVATGDSSNQPSVGDAHDMAAKTAVSQALKRCAKDLGDQFGLSLYNGGSVRPCVGVTLVWPDGITVSRSDHTEVEDHAPENLGEHDDRAPAGDVLLADSGAGEQQADWAYQGEGDVSPHEDLGGQLPIATPREHIEQARETLPPQPDVVMIARGQLSRIMGQAGRIWKGYSRAEIDEKAQHFCFDYVSRWKERTIHSRTELTFEEAAQIIELLEAKAPEPKPEVAS